MSKQTVIFYSCTIFGQLCGEGMMKLLGKSKITKKQAKPEFTYPLVRLPQSEMNIAGETAHIFKTEYNGKPVYVIALDEELNCELKVAQPELKSDLEARVEQLEKKLSTLLDSENKENKNKKEKWARGNSNPGPPPCEGDVITV